MPKELKALTDGTFSLSETEDPNQFYFYRNDGKVLGDVGQMPFEFYQQYIVAKMMSGEITEMVINNICCETSNDDRCVRITISGVEEYKTIAEYPKEENEKERISQGTETTPKTSFFEKLFGKK